MVKFWRAGLVNSSRVLEGGVQQGEPEGGLGILERTGCHCEIAENGAVALANPEKRQFDVTLMVDDHMPVMDGDKGVRRIRESPICLIPIVALTAGAWAEDRERFAEADMGQFLAKPFRAEDLINRLQSIHEAPVGIAALPQPPALRWPEHVVCKSPDHPRRRRSPDPSKRSGANWKVTGAHPCRDHQNRRGKLGVPRGAGKRPPRS